MRTLLYCTLLYSNRLYTTLLYSTLLSLRLHLLCLSFSALPPFTILFWNKSFKKRFQKVKKKYMYVFNRFNFFFFTFVSKILCFENMYFKIDTFIYFTKRFARFFFLSFELLHFFSSKICFLMLSSLLHGNPW